MELALVRVDNRLIHGQVSTAWVQQLRIDKIIVVNDKAATNPTEKAVLKMAKPRTIKSLEILTVKQAAEMIKTDKSKDRVMVIGQNPRDIKGLMDNGVEINEVNLGNMHGGPGKTILDDCIAADDEELEILKEWNAKGIKMFSQMTPSSSRTDINKKLSG